MSARPEPVLSITMRNEENIRKQGDDAEHPSPRRESGSSRTASGIAPEHKADPSAVAPKPTPADVAGAGRSVERSDSKEMGHVQAPKKENDDKTGEKGAVATMMGKLPDWLQKALKTPRMWKNFTRCMIATLATMVLMLAQRSLDVLGQSAFFGLIVSQMLPPSMALSIYFFAFMTLVVGMCMGWAWGCAAMAAALRARSATLLASAVAREQATYTQSTNIDAQYQASIFHGAFLDPRSSVVFGIFLFVGAYGCGFLRAKMPRLTLGAIFGTIMYVVVMCSYGPLFPISQYTLANNLLIPAACFLAIALASTILIFPQSLHSIVLDLVSEACFTPIKGMLDLQEAVLSASPSDRKQWGGLAEKAYGLRKAHVMGVGGIDGQTKLMGLEISRGRLGPVELVRIIEKQKELGARAYSLASFVMIIDERANALAKLNETSDSTQHRRKQYVQNIANHQQPGTSLHDLLPILKSSTADLRSAASDALGEIIAYLQAVNHSRWRKLSGKSMSDREAALARMQRALSSFKSQDAHEMLGPFAAAFDADGKLDRSMVAKMRYSARDLFTCYVFTTSLTSFSQVLVELLELVIGIEKKNQHNSWHFPTNIGKAIAESANDKNGGNPLDMHRDGSEETLVDSEPTASKSTKSSDKSKKANKHKQWPKDPDASDPKNAFQRFGRGLYALWRGLTGVNGIFALKYGIVTMALWTPQVIQSSAYFVYTNRGLWALIMAQTGMGVFTGEQIGSFFLRMGGTILGLVWGMVAWYIGAQLGSGNPYGVAAATMVIIAVPLFIRIAAPMQSPPMIVSLMTGVTITFVVGYSWVDEHVYQLANQGSGAGLAGRRALLVIIGFTAAFIVMLFPKPTSARKIVRHSLARNLQDISDLYAAVISGWEEEAEWDEDDEGHNNAGQEKGAFGSDQRKTRQVMYRERFTNILERMGRIAPQLSFASLEPGLKGPWPKEEYTELMKLQSQMISALALLAGCYARLNVKWAKRLEAQSELMHPAFIADCLSLFALLHQSLRNGHPLPSTMPIFERLGYHSQYIQHRRAHQAHNQAHSREETASGYNTPTHTRVQHDGPSEAVTPSSSSVNAQLAEGEERIEKQEAQVVKDLGSDFTIQTMKDEQFAIFSVANVALIHITSCLNELHQVVKRLVGERELVGFEQTQERWARMEMTSV